MSQAQETLRILLVDDELLVREELGAILEESGYDVITGADGEEGLALFRSERPDMVITDVRMPRRDGLSVAMTIREEAPSVPVTVITGHGTEAMAIKALRAGVTDFVKKPVRLEDLKAALSRMRAAHHKPSTEPALIHPAAVEVVELLWSYKLQNDLEVVPSFVDMLVSRCAASLSATGAMELSLALRELIINAVEHGNLGVSFAEKTRALESGSMTQLLQERGADPERHARRVEVQAHLKEGLLTVQIKDEGEGFDGARLPDPLDLSRQLAPNGRGLLLARMSVDSIEYNDIGNLVIVTKAVNAPGEAP